MFTSTI